MELFVKDGVMDFAGSLVVELNQMDHALHLLDRMEKMWKDDHQCDFMIKVEGEELHTHKNVICSFSDYFDAMLRHDTKERQQGFVEMKDVDFECIKACVQYMYTGKFAISQEKYEEVMHAAHVLQLQKLCDAVAELLEKRLNTQSFFGIKRIATLYGCRKLEEKCSKFAAKNLAKIASEYQFLSIDKDYIIELLSLPSADYVSERVKIDALITWIQCDTGRSDHFVELLSYISLNKVPLGYRRYLIENNSLISQSCEVLKAISLSVMDTLNVKAVDFSNETLSVICVFDKRGSLYCFNTIENTWTKMHELNEDIAQNKFSSVAFENYIFALMSSRSVYRLDYQDRDATWEKMADMTDDHGWCPPATVLANYIYVMGGHNHCATKSCERYDIRENIWEKLPDFRHPSQFTEIYGFDGCIYAVGGRKSGSYSKQLCRFDEETLSWSELASMKEKKGGVAAVFHGNKLYVFGGHLADYQELNSVELYDPLDDSWTDLPSMKETRSWFDIHEIEGIFYAVGGYKSQNFIEKVDLDLGTRDLIKIPQEMIVVNSVKIKWC